MASTMNGRGQQQLVGGRIEHAAESALPAEALGEEAVGSIRYRGDDEQAQRAEQLAMQQG